MYTSCPDVHERQACEDAADLRLNVEMATTESLQRCCGLLNKDPQYLCEPSAPCAPVPMISELRASPTSDSPLSICFYLYMPLHNLSMAA